MKASQPDVSNGSSASFISGSPIVVPAVEWFEENIVDILMSAIDSAEKSATKELRDKASSIKGWDKIAEDLKVSVEGGEIVVGQTGSFTDLNSYSSDLEYGTGESPPSPLLRKTMIREETKLVSDIHRNLEKDLPVA
jgi:hypothetical protein